MKYFLSILFFSLLLVNTYSQDSTFLSIYDRYWEIDGGYYRVMQSGKIGLVNQTGELIIPCENEQVWNLQENGNIKVLKEGKLGIYNVRGELVVPPVYDMIWDFKNGRARVMRSGKVGYVNESGNEYIPCKYDQIWDFEDGKARVLRNGKVGYINDSGNEYISAQYQKIWDFEDGRAKVFNNGKMGFINESGYEFIPTIYQKIWDFEDGRAKVLKNGKMGYINETGQEIIPCIYQQIGDFNDGIARAVKDSHVLYIDENGNPTEYQPDITEESIEVSPAVVDKQSYSGNILERDTTNINLLGSSMQIIKEDGSTEVSFEGRNKHEYYRKERKKKTVRSFNGHYTGVDLGFNTYLTKSGDIALPDEYNYLSLNSGKSVGLSANILQQDIPLGKRGNIGLVTGLGLTFNNYRFDNPIVPLKDEIGMLTYNTIEEDLIKSKLTTLYLNAPLLLELQFSKKRRDGFYISAGAVVGYRISSHTKVVTNIDGEKTKDKNRDSFNLNDFRYGAQVRLGYKDLNFYGSYYLSPLFNKNKAPELYPVSVGISFYPDWW